MIAAVMILIGPAAACGSENTRRRANDVATPALAGGAWRLVDPAELEVTMLWVSHILITHERSMPHPALHDGPTAPWKKPSRTVTEALTAATRIRTELAKDPSRFEDVARISSEDTTTAPRGGALGGMAASRLPAPFLDELSMMKPGELSRPIATIEGFHILFFHQPPAPERISGKRIVIGHQEAPQLALQSGVAPTRSREEARTLAQRLAEEARSDPTKFDALAREHSEHPDGARAGDFGVWWNVDPRAPAEELYSLSRLRVGEVGEPIETPIGFQIVMRTATTEREAFAIRSSVFVFDRTLIGNGPDTRSHALANAQRALSMPNTSAFAMEHPSNSGPGVEVESWLQGSYPPAMENAVAETKIGAVSAKPVELPDAFVIFQRIAPPRNISAQPSTRFELPKAASPDLKRLVQNAIGEALGRQLHHLSGELARELPLTEPEAVAVSQTLDRLASKCVESTDKTARGAAFDAALVELQSLLGPSRARVALAHVESWATHQLLNERQL